MIIEDKRSETFIDSSDGVYGKVYYSETDGYVMRITSNNKVAFNCSYVILSTGGILLGYSATLQVVNCKLVIE